MQYEQATVDGRTVRVVTGQISQTVNVCTTANKLGDYEWIVRLMPGRFVERAEVEKYPDIEALVNWLETERHGHVERRPTDETEVEEPRPEPRSLDPEDKIWVERAMRITEICIDELVREFLELPYLHRVEHSIHTRLHAILSTQPHFARHFPLGQDGTVTQAIHKEWPETVSRGNGRRGNFDLAILPPHLLRTSSPRSFATGRIVPPIVIEMGMNYDEGHLEDDADKLIHSSVQHGYLVHLLREKPPKETIDCAIETVRQSTTIKVAFARYEGGAKYAKFLNDTEIHPL